MKKSLIIARRELDSFFDSLTAYIVMVIFLGFTGFFTWIFSRSNIFYMGQASMEPFFNIAYWTLFFFIPALTMKMVAEEKKSGTIELLVTKPVSDWQIVFGKFIATISLIGIAIAFSFIYYFFIWSLGPVDHGAVWTGYLGLLLMSGVYISFGIFFSSITNNQIVAFLTTLMVGVFFHIIFGMMASASKGLPGEILDYLSMQSHFQSISAGVIDFKDLIYFFSLILIGLVGSEMALSKRNIVD